VGRYRVSVYDRAGPREHHECATREEALALARRLRRERGQRNYTIVVTDAERDGRAIDEEDEEP